MNLQRLICTFFVMVFLTVSAEASLLNVQMSSEPTQFDPLLLEDGTGLKIAANTIGTLFQYNGKGERSKALLDNYSVSRDRRAYTFRFRKNLKWSDGKPFLAEHFLLAVTRVAREPIKVALSGVFPKIDLKRTRIIDDHTAELVMEEPDEQLPNWLTLPPFAPIRQDMIDSITTKHSPVVPTMAAYEVVDYKHGESMLLRKNPQYFNRDEATIDEVRIRFIEDEAALLPLLKAGSIDILNKVPVLQLNQIEEAAKVANVPVEAVTYLAFNTKKKPFNDKNSRQLLRDVIDQRKRMELTKLLKTGEIAAITYLPESLLPPGYHQVPSFETPPKKTGEKLEFSIQSDLSSRNQTMLEFIQSELKKELQWKTTLDLIDFKSHYAKLKTEPDALYRFGWQNPVSDPFITYQVLTSKSPNNFTGWANEKYDSLVEELRQETRMVKRLKLVSELEAILQDEAPVVPLIHQVLRFAYSKRVVGFRANPFGVILFRELRLNESTPQSKSTAN